MLLRYGTLNQLEAKRDELLSDRIIQIQAYCRGYLLRKRVAQKRVQVCFITKLNKFKILIINVIIINVGISSSLYTT